MGRFLASNIKDFPVAAAATGAHQWLDAFVNQVHGEAAASPSPLQCTKILLSLNP